MSLGYALKEKTDWHDKALWHVRSKRDKAVKQVPEWETLRETASTIKDHTLAHLDKYLEQFERNAIDNGVGVHWATDADEHNRIAFDLLQKNGVQSVVKSKSMLTEECGLNEYLEERGVEVIDTDLGERIIQLKDERPSHIVMPAIHLKKEEISDLFNEKLHTEKGNADPAYLTEAARQHLRQKFLDADAAMTGVNFAIAETGGIVVCTNEGNADMGIHAAPLTIHSMGIEKIIPRVTDLGVFTRLLARSGTGQPITIYTSHIHKPRPKTAMHIIIVDNGRSRHLGRESFRNGLKCIRCGACMNTCPVYRRGGGHSYRATVPGPIGSILNPGTDVKQYSDLPFASSLCGSCADVCPVKIDIHEQLYKWRQEIEKGRSQSITQRIVLYLVSRALSDSRWYNMATSIMRAGLRLTPGFILEMNEWGKHRELPELPRAPFKQWYKKNRRNEQG